jgi:hypothetical protein
MMRVRDFDRVLPPAPTGERYGVRAGVWFVILGFEQWENEWSGCLELVAVVSCRLADRRGDVRG